ncbi:MAG: DNA repair protein RecO [Candidatus Neomarinimicrobiota bacterium]
MIINTPAVVLRSFPYGETSIIARCYTRDHGKVSVIVKGARRKKSPMAAYFQSMNYLDIVYYFRETRSLQALSKASFIEIWSELNQDLKKIAYGLAVIELTEKTNTEHDPHPELFDELVAVLKALNRSDLRLNLIFWYFQIKLLTILGFKPDFQQREQGNIKFPNPFAGPNSEKILEDISINSIDSISNITAMGKDRKAISEYLAAFMSYHFEGLDKLKSFSVLKQII